jgi:hypothetical protein
MLLDKPLEKYFSLALTLALTGIAPPLSAQVPKTVTAVGPVESLDCPTRKFQVVGITFSAGSSAALRDLCDAANHEVFKLVVVVCIVGAKKSVTVTKLAVVSNANYTPGSSYVYVSGLVTNPTSNDGEFWISGSRILSSSGPILATEAYVQVIGTQPTVNGPIVASALDKADGLTPGLVFEGALQDIIGSDRWAHGIIGSGVVAAGIAGSGAIENGIVGSGVVKSGIAASSVVKNGIIGSGQN